jgi:hypothetical protein
MTAEYKALIWLLVVALMALFIWTWFQNATARLQLARLEVRVGGLESWVGEVNAAITKVMGWFGIK